METRRTLVRVGRHLFARSGFEAVSSEQLVAKARVTRGALYHHFDGKAGLFRAVLGEAMGEVHARLAKAASKAATPLEALEIGITSFLRACTDSEYQRILLVDGPAVLGWKAWRALDLEYGLGLLRRGLEAANLAGQLALSDPETTTHLLAGALIDGAMRIATSPGDSSVGPRVEAAALQLLHAFYPARRKER